MTKAIVIVTLGLLVVAIAAPFWARTVGLGLPDLPPPGALVTIAGGHRLNVFDHGNGQPVVLVHGLPGSAHDWRPLPDQLAAARFRVIRYDRTGYGHSTSRPPEDSHSVTANAADLLGLIAALDLDRPILVGWSYGGGVALSAADQAPSRVGALLLVGSDGPAGPSFGWFATFFVLTQPLRSWGIASGIPVRFGIASMGRRAFQQSVPAWWPAHALSVIASSKAQRTWTREVRDFDPDSIRVEGIRVPVTLVHGTSDAFVPPSVAAASHRQIAGSVLVRIEGGGHMLPNTHTDRILDEVRALAVR